MRATEPTARSRPGRRVLLAACLTFFAVAAGAAQAPGKTTVADLLAAHAPAPTHTVSYGDDPLQFGHLRLPAGPGPHPVVIFVHGGCWLSQFTIGHAAALEQGLSDAGYAVWSLEYRRVGDAGGGWPNTFLDLAHGTDYLRTLARRFSLDTTRVIAAGHSAGGQFALWLAARTRIDKPSALFVERPLAIRGVLALAPAPDLEGLHAAGVCGNVIDKLMGGSPAELPQRYQAASPMALAPIGVAQRLVVGGLDRDWGPVGRRYYDRAIAAGDRAAVLVDAPESGHFDMILPGTTSWQIVIESLRSLLAPAH